jgi:hypothetical protein
MNFNIYPGSTGHAQLQLDTAGSYFILAAPAYSQQLPCDSLNRYWFTINVNYCITPTTLSAINITATEADLSWNSNGTSWNVEWGPAGFTQGNGTMISGTNSNPHHLTGLSMGTYYSFYVQSDCGDGNTSSWAGPFTFYTTCPATSLPFLEDFTNQPVGPSPQCWKDQSPNDVISWHVEDSNIAGGSNPEVVFNPSNNYFNGTAYLVSPVINTTGQSTLNLTFMHSVFWWGYEGSSGNFTVRTTSDGGVTWNDVWLSMISNSVFSESIYVPISNGDVGSSSFQIAFAYTGLSYYLGNWDIDDISLTGTTPVGPPVTAVIQNDTIYSGETNCYDATQTITVAGGGTTFVVENGGSATMIAGMKISYLTGTSVASGGYMLGKIAPSGPFCGAKSASVVSAEDSGEEEKPLVAEKQQIRVYPNPTNGRFTMKLTTNNPQQAPVQVEIFGMRGERILTETLTGESTHEFSLTDHPAGIYLIKAVTGGDILTTKLVKTE